MPLSIFVDGLNYAMELTQKVSLPPEPPRLVVVSRQQNQTATYARFKVRFPSVFVCGLTCCFACSSIRL